MGSRFCTAATLWRFYPCYTRRALSINRAMTILQIRLAQEAVGGDHISKLATLPYEQGNPDISRHKCSHNSRTDMPLHHTARSVQEAQFGLESLASKYAMCNTSYSCQRTRSSYPFSCRIASFPLFAWHHHTSARSSDHDMPVKLFVHVEDISFAEERRSKISPCLSTRAMKSTVTVDTFRKYDQSL